MIARLVLTCVAVTIFGAAWTMWLVLNRLASTCPSCETTLR